MNIAQVVALMVGVAFSLTSASVSFINMVTSAGPEYPRGFGSSENQTTPICYWVVGLLFICLAGSLNRMHKPIATAIGIPGILLMLTGGIGSFIFMFQSQMIPIALNVASTLVYLTAIFLIYKFDKPEKTKPIYQTNPTSNPMPVAKPLQTPTSGNPG